MTTGYKPGDHMAADLLIAYRCSLVIIKESEGRRKVSHFVFNRLAPEVSTGLFVNTLCHLN